MSMKKKSAEDGKSEAADIAAPPAKVLRADARKNRDKLLDVAHRVFKTDGVSVSMDEIARQAGVGVGTVYRHFPAKEDLIAAVIVSHKARLIQEAAQWLDHDDAGEAFFRYFDSLIRAGLANKAITDALVHRPNSEVGHSRVAHDFWRSVDLLLVRAQQDGYVREDVDIEDIKVLLTGILMATGDSGVFPHRVASILYDGLRGKR
jgi:AcrR family transcriptional regulator